MKVLLGSAEGFRLDWQEKEEGLEEGPFANNEAELNHISPYIYSL